MFGDKVHVASGVIENLQKRIVNLHEGSLGERFCFTRKISLTTMLSNDPFGLMAHYLD